MRQRGFSLGVMSWGNSTLVLPGESASLLAGRILCHYSQGILSCYSIELLLSCGGGFWVLLEVGKVTWGSFRVVVRPPLELHGAAALKK